MALTEALNMWIEWTDTIEEEERQRKNQSATEAQLELERANTARENLLLLRSRKRRFDDEDEEDENEEEKERENEDDGILMRADSNDFTPSTPASSSPSSPGPSRRSQSAVPTRSRRQKKPRVDELSDVNRTQMLVDAMDRMTSTLERARHDPAVQDMRNEMDGLKKQVNEGFNAVMQQLQKGTQNNQN